MDAAALKAVAGGAVLKILVLGDPATGKTSIIKRFCYAEFSEHHRTTIAVDFAMKNVVVDEDKSVRVQLWDIAGQDRFGSLVRIFYKDALGAMLVYDLTREDTFETITKWKREVDDKVQLPSGEALPCILVGNKSDKVEGEIDADRLDAFCSENGFVGWYATSAKLNEKIEESISGLVTNVLTRKGIFPEGEEDDEEEGVAVAGEGGGTQGGCCPAF
jgi:Ras-related protein Rab-32